MKHLQIILAFGRPYLRRYWPRLALGVLLGVIYGFSNGLAVWGARVVFERLSGTPAAVSAPATPGRGPALLTRLDGGVREALDPWLPRAGRRPDGRQVAGAMLLLPLLMALRGYSGYFSNYFMTWVSERTVCDVRVALLARLSGLSLDYFNRVRSGDLITRINADAAALQSALGSRLADLVKEPFTVLSIVILLLALNWQLALFALVFLPLCVLPISRLGRKAREAGRRLALAASQQAGLLVEFLAGIRVVKAFGLESRQIERFSHFAHELFGQGMRAMRAREMANPVVEIFSAFALSALILYIALRGVQFTDMVTFLIGTAALYTPVKRLSALHITFAQASVAAERIQQVLLEQPTVRDPAQPRPPGGFAREIRFENVAFAYAQQPVLTGFNLILPRGQKLGVAGESGSGKSTLVNLLFRFYDPTAGRLTFDGVDIREVAMADLRGQMALVSQEIVLFDQTVRENIACGRAGATAAEVEAAARAAFAHDFILALPQGYETPVGERGVTLSGGQRQRIAIARAFVRNAPILVLDEATAALDSQAEQEVQAALERLEENRTVICVAHRLSTLANMDRLLVLAAGRIIEEGTFGQLVRSGGVFSGMARLQGITA